MISVKTYVSNQCKIQKMKGSTCVDCQARKKLIQKINKLKINLKKKKKLMQEGWWYILTHNLLFSKVLTYIFTGYTKQKIFTN